ncbi:hypothetical protein K2173_010696 [Erythroxylum novogranatense]|uniref:Aminotransferase-like plant mobile domain-containing protein n=1 Tax=Erythroxylum novogranatense TaxID=1862640 RepID=A0AAV8SRN6_9ROSI|nr:hypothetical protein K2173_010696 [Erythroxylum novogranatense]
MEELSDFIVESREEFMISATGQGKPVLRTAHFLKPTSTNIGESISKPHLPTISLPAKVKAEKGPLSVTFRAWNKPSEQWKEWVEKMVSLHETTWERAGVHEAIMNSTYTIVKDCDLIFGIAERWRPDTKSFIFPWGEATVTLEDLLMIGYSDLGAPVFLSLDDEELKPIKIRLILARKEMIRTRAKKASHTLWMRKFMDSGNEVEHEAFLAYWLSRFVLSTARDTISDFCLSIAIHLARGTRIALAPAILASLYRDLSILEENLPSLESNKGRKSKNRNDDVVTVAVTSPFQLIQVWIWERFVELRPEPNLTKNGEPRLARWDKLTCRIEDVRLCLDSAKENFIWRPYDKIMPNWTTPFSDAAEEVVDSGLDEEILSFSQCLKVSELVGHCLIEQYLPHRVAMQFGFDQDIPGYVTRFDMSPEVSWSYYNRPMIDAMRYLPFLRLEGKVTTRYLDCWKQSISSLQGKRQKTTSRAKPMSLKGKSIIKSNCEFVSPSKGFSLMLQKNKALMETSKEKSKGETSASSKLKPDTGNGVKNHETFFSSLKVTSEASKQEEDAECNSFISGISPQISKQKNDNSSVVVPGSLGEQAGIVSKRNHKVSNLSATPDVYEFIQKRSAQSLKRKNGENHEVACPSCPSKLTRTLVQDFASVKEINSRLVPPGFPPKRMAEASHSVEEGNIIAVDNYVLKPGYKNADPESEQCRDGNIFSGNSQSTSCTAFKESSISEETCVENEAVEKQKANETNTSPLVNNKSVRSSDPKILPLKEATQPEALGSRQDRDGDNKFSHSAQSHPLMSKTGGGEGSNYREPFSINGKQIASAESTTLEQAGEHANRSPEEIFDMPSITENVGESSSYLIQKPWLRLEVLIGRLEKLSSDLKAAKFGGTAMASF